MQELDDIMLLREYAERDSEEAFATLVSRHVNKVYSVALRHTRNPHQAEEITQAVFVILAQKSGHLGKDVILSGWLYQTARLTAVTLIRGEIRRARREEEAHMQTLLNETESDVWPQIAPLLDAAIAGLSETDRHAVVLRFFDGKSMKEVGAALGASEDAAKMRVNRAVEKLRLFFTKRGVVVPAAVLTATISANSVQAAPVTLAKTATAVALAKGATASISTLTLIKGALKIMAWTKTQLAFAVGAGLLLTAGTAIITVKQVEAHRANLDSWRVPNLNANVLARTAPQARILPTKFSGKVGAFLASGDNLKWIGVRAPVSVIVWTAYDWPPGRLLFPGGEPHESYDYVSTLPQGSAKALQGELKDKLGLVGRRETMERDVLVLKVRNPGASGLKSPILGDTDDWLGFGGYHCGDKPLSVTYPQPPAGLTRYLEFYFQMPVIDRTGLTQHFKIDLKWKEIGGVQDPNHKAIKRALLDQLGLELVPGREPVEMLVVEKAQ